MNGKEEHTLFLLPAPICSSDIHWFIPSLVINKITEIQVFIVENAKTARHFLKSIHPSVDWSVLTFFELDKHNPASQKDEIRELLLSAPETGLLSEAGMPCIADPGNHVVRIAHDNGIRVRPMTGPSSVMLALIASGLNGQQFAFNGYLPGKPEERRRSIISLEKSSAGATQLFIETPYRNEVLFADLLKTLKGDTRLMIARDIGGENELISCKKIAQWRNEQVTIGKMPCLFAIG